MKAVSRIAAGLAGVALSALALVCVALIDLTATIALDLPDPDPSFDSGAVLRPPGHVGGRSRGHRVDARHRRGRFAAGVCRDRRLQMGVGRPSALWRKLAIIPVGAVAAVAIVTEPWWGPSSSRPARAQVMSLISHRTVSGVGIGATRDEVRSALGESHDVILTRPPVWAYRELDVTFHRGRVFRLTLHARRADMTRLGLQRMLGNRLISYRRDPRRTFGTQIAIKTGTRALVIFDRSGRLDRVSIMSSRSSASSR